MRDFGPDQDDQQELFFRTGRIEWFCDGEREEDRCVESYEKECR